MAARMPMIASTTKSSSRVKPFSFFITFPPFPANAPRRGEHPLGTGKGLTPHRRCPLGNRVSSAVRTIAAIVDPGSGKRSGDAITGVSDRYLRAVCETCGCWCGRIRLILGIERFCREHGVVGIGLYPGAERLIAIRSKLRDGDSGQDADNRDHNQ